MIWALLRGAGGWETGGFVVVEVIIVGFGIGMLIVRWRVLDNACFPFLEIGMETGRSCRWILFGYHH